MNKKDRKARIEYLENVIDFLIRNVDTLRNELEILEISNETYCECGKKSEKTMVIFGINYLVCKDCEQIVNKILGNSD